MNIARIHFHVLAVILMVAWIIPANAEEKGIEVTGTARQSVVPDMATFSFSINTRGETLQPLKQDVDAKSAALISHCRKLGIKSKSISSAEVSIRPQYNYQTKSFIGYEVSRHIRVELHDLDKYTDLVNGAIKAGITTIGGITLDRRDREKLENDALGAAVDAARDKAGILAKRAGVRLGKVVFVREGAMPVRQETFRVAEMASSASMAQGAFEPGEISVTATVSVRFAID